MKLIACEFNMDSGCVELRFDDGTELDIDCTAIENKYGHTIRQRSELDWLIYNAPLEYAQLVLAVRSMAIRMLIHLPITVCAIKALHLLVRGTSNRGGISENVGYTAQYIHFLPDTGSHPVSVFL